MSKEMPMRIIARIHNDFSSKFGIPRQSGLVDSLISTIVFEPEFRNLTRSGGWMDIPTYGCSGSFLRR